MTKWWCHVGSWICESGHQGKGPSFHQPGIKVRKMNEISKQVIGDREGIKSEVWAWHTPILGPGKIQRKQQTEKEWPKRWKANREGLIILGAKRRSGARRNWSTMIKAANGLKNWKYDAAQGPTNHQSRIAKQAFIPCRHHNNSAWKLRRKIELHLMKKSYTQKKLYRILYTLHFPSC